MSTTRRPVYHVSALCHAILLILGTYGTAFGQTGSQSVSCTNRAETAMDILTEELRTRPSLRVYTPADLAAKGCVTPLNAEQTVRTWLVTIPLSDQDRTLWFALAPSADGLQIRSGVHNQGPIQWLRSRFDAFLPTVWQSTDTLLLRALTEELQNRFNVLLRQNSIVNVVNVVDMP